MNLESDNCMRLLVHVEPKKAPSSLRRAHISRVHKGGDLIVVQGPVFFNGDVGAIMSFVDVFKQIFDAFYESTALDVDMTVVL